MRKLAALTATAVAVAGTLVATAPAAQAATVAAWQGDEWLVQRAAPPS